MAAVVVVLTYALPALAQEPAEDADGTRDGAVSLGNQSPSNGRQFFYNKSLDRTNGDAVDYYSFTTDGRYELGLGARDQRIELQVTLEDADGKTVGTAGPPLNKNKNQVYIEWLKTTIPAGTYYIRVEALEYGQTGYYIRFGLSEPRPNSVPAFGSATYDFSVAEDASTGDAVGSVSATDADNDALTYTIESGDENGKFAISNAGAITTAGELDHETDASYTLTVQADDGNGGTATATVNVSVTDLDEPREKSLSGFSLIDASDQTVLATLSDGGSVELADPDGGSYAIRVDLADGKTVGSVRLELSGAKSVSRTENIAPYSLYGDSGANALEGEGLPAGSYTLRATAYSERRQGGDELGAVEMTFTITKANSAPEFGSASYDFSIADDAATGAAVGDVAATDADEDTLAYTIEAGDEDGKFAISNEGAITTAGELDHETDASYTLTVQADDGNGGTATATVTVTVTDGDENSAPEFGSGSYSFSVAEDAATGAAVGEVTATDADEDTLAYTIESGNKAARFAISSTGAITVAGALDYETDASYTLTVQADDGNSGTATATVTVAVTEVEESPNGLHWGTTSDGVPFVQFHQSTPANGPGDDDPPVALQGNSDAPPIQVKNPPGQYLLPQGLWSDNTTLWVSARGASLEEDVKLYAYVLATGERDAEKDIQLVLPDLPRPRGFPQKRDGATGLWMTADTIWASAGLIDKVLGYHRKEVTNTNPPISAGARKPGEDFNTLPREAHTPVGLWSDGTDMYIADYQMGRIYVHNLSTKAHVKTLLTAREEGNRSPVGLWSDGTTMWVADTRGAKVYAYELADWSRVPLLDIEDLAEENGRPQGLWSDGMRLWVADLHSDKVFIYDLPSNPAPEKETRLRRLQLWGVNMRYFRPNGTDYVTSSPQRYERARVFAEPLAAGASVVITPADSQPEEDGHWVELEDDGETEVTVTVTSADSMETLVYTIRILQGDEVGLGWFNSRSRLTSFSATGAPDPALEFNGTRYAIQMEPGTYLTTVTAVPDISGLPVVITPADADPDTPGHQVQLQEGANVVRVTVLGRNHRTYSFTITAGEGFTQVSAGSVRSCALRADGSIACWGTPLEGSPNLNAAPGIYTDVYAGPSEICTVDLDGLGECWTHSGQHTVEDVKMIRAGSGRICWIKTNGDVGCDIDFGETPDGEFKSVEVGSYRFTCAINKDGKAVCWGDKRALEQYRTLFDRLVDSSNTYTLLAVDIISLCGLKTDNTVVCVKHDGASAKWLDGTFAAGIYCIVKLDGEADCLTRGESRSYTQAVMAEAPGPFETVSIGGTHICGLRTDKTVACWGVDRENRLDVPSIASPWADDARLLKFGLSGIELNQAFDPAVTEYTASVANAVDKVTVLARATNTRATLEFSPSADADGSADGHQVDLSTGENTITVTVTSANGEDTTTYTVKVTRASP